MKKSVARKGYGIFGKEYDFMLKNDLHDKRSIDHLLLQNMILIDQESIPYLYKKPKSVSNNNKNHELFNFAQQFKGVNELESLLNIFVFLNEVVKNFDVPFEEMYFGGTEKEIIERGSDWCTDISRVGVALLQCLSIPSRIAIVVNGLKAYHGHQVVEAYIDEQYIMCDFLYGVIGKSDKYYSVNEMLNKPDLIRSIYQNKIEDDETLNYIVGIFNSAAITKYDITKKHNYSVSKANEYYLNMMKLIHDGTWQMDETKMSDSINNKALIK